MDSSHSRVSASRDERGRVVEPVKAVWDYLIAKTKDDRAQYFDDYTNLKTVYKPLFITVIYKDIIKPFVDPFVRSDKANIIINNVDSQLAALALVISTYRDEAYRLQSYLVVFAIVLIYYYIVYLLTETIMSPNRSITGVLFLYRSFSFILSKRKWKKYIFK